MKLWNSLKSVAGMLLATLVLAGPASAAVLYFHAPVDTFVGIQADASTLPQVDHISVGGPAIITSVTWWGFYDGGDPSGDAFVLKLGGNTQSGSITTSAFNSLTQYTMELSSDFAFAGGPLDVSLVNDSFDVQWFWQGSQDASGLHALQLDGSRASNVPEPGSLLLFGAAGCVLLILSRRTLRTRRPD